jgi:hypothetical protein
VFLLFECDAESGENLDLIAISKDFHLLVNKADEIAELGADLNFKDVSVLSGIPEWESPANVSKDRTFVIQQITVLE